MEGWSKVGEMEQVWRDGARLEGWSKVGGMEQG